VSDPIRAILREHARLNADPDTLSDDADLYQMAADAAFLVGELESVVALTDAALDAMNPALSDNRAVACWLLQARTTWSLGRHDAALAHWAATRRDVSHAVFALDLRPEGMASDGFHPGEPVYRVCGEALAAHVAKTIAEVGNPATDDRSQRSTLRHTAANDSIEN